MCKGIVYIKEVSEANGGSVHFLVHHNKDTRAYLLTNTKHEGQLKLFHRNTELASGTVAVEEALHTILGPLPDTADTPKDLCGICIAARYWNEALMKYPVAKAV